MIHVVALVTAQPGQREAMLAAFRENVPAVHAEAGCIAYQPVVDATDIGPFQAKLGEDTFMVLEPGRAPRACTPTRPRPTWPSTAARPRA